LIVHPIALSEREDHMGLLEIANVSKAFGGLIALNGLSAVVEEGKIYGLIGPNGAGKTTLFNIASGYYKPDSGDIVFAGERVTQLGSHERCARGLARTFQIPKMFPEMTVVDNVLIGALSRTKAVKAARSDAERIVESLGMTGKEGALAGSLKVHELKRLEIAKALATKPRLLLLDEPMGGMNAVEQDQLIHLLKKVHDAGTTLLVVEHVMHAVVNLCDHVVVMNCGQKIVEGGTREVLANEEVIRIYLGEEDPC
jgi:branched-chain amino acid transport system ATP-binding protein